MSVLTAEQILAAQDLKQELVHVPEWGGDVYVRAMTGSEYDAFEVAQYKRAMAGRKLNGKAVAELSVEDILDKSADATADLVARTACDESGALLFTMEQVSALGAKATAPLKRLAEVAQRLNGIGATAAGNEALEELEKN